MVFETTNNRTQSTRSRSHSKRTKGNIVDWEEAEWNLSEGMEWIEQTTDDVCLLPKPKNTIFPEDRTNRDDEFSVSALHFLPAAKPRRSMGHVWPPRVI